MKNPASRQKLGKAYCLRVSSVLSQFSKCSFNLDETNGMLSPQFTQRWNNFICLKHLLQKSNWRLLILFVARKKQVLTLATVSWNLFSQM